MRLKAASELASGRGKEVLDALRQVTRPIVTLGALANGSFADAMFSGDLQEDLQLLERSTLPLPVCRLLWQYLRAGGMENAMPRSVVPCRRASAMLAGEPASAWMMTPG